MKWTAAALLVAAACGNPYRDELRRNAQFDCRDQGPRIVRWTVTRDGNRDEHQASLGVGEFDRLWEKIDGAGWRYLKDCDGTGQPEDPVYSFDVKDWNGSVSFSCTNAGPLPYPYNTIVDELDFKAAAAAPKDNRKPDAEDLR